MKWYSRHVGDYTSATRHLTMLQHGAFSMLLDHYYATEKPLPANAEQLHRICCAFDIAEREAIDYVLREFFTLTEFGWQSSKVEEEIDKMKEIGKKRAEAGKKARKNDKKAPKDAEIEQGDMDDDALDMANAQANEQANAQQLLNTSSVSNNHNHIYKEEEEERASADIPPPEEFFLQPTNVGHHEPTNVANGKDTSVENQKAAKDEVGFSVGLGRFTGITEDLLARWNATYTHITVSTEIAMAADWLDANKKRYTNYKKFLVNWLIRAEGEAKEKALRDARRHASGQSSTYSKPSKGVTKDENRNRIASQLTGQSSQTTIDVDARPVFTDPVQPRPVQPRPLFAKPSQPDDDDDAAAAAYRAY